MTKKIGHFHVVTDETVQSRFSHVELAERAIAGGAETIQFREKERGAGEMVEIAAAIREVCRKANVALIINDRVDIALAVDADGVHLGRDDFPIAAARELLGPDKIIGGSAETLQSAAAVAAEGADYVGVGHIYPTSSKIMPGPPLGPEGLRRICDALHVPVIAIGGINSENFDAVLEAGAWGIAVIGAVCASPDPARAASAFRFGIDARFGRSS